MLVKARKPTDVIFVPRLVPSAEMQHDGILYDPVKVPFAHADCLIDRILSDVIIIKLIFNLLDLLPV